jgi:hypothetical protein
LVISEEAIEKACGVFEQVLEKFKSEGSKWKLGSLCKHIFLFYQKAIGASHIIS